MSMPRKARVRDSIKKVQQFWKYGHVVLKDLTARGTVAGVESWADRLGLGGDAVRKARAFANPETGYDEQDLGRLLRQMHSQASQSKDGPVFCRSHVVRLLAVPRGRKRDLLQARAIEGAWSVRDLDAEIERTVGKREFGGRPFKLAVTAAGLRSQLRRFRRQMVGWAESLEALAVEGTGEVRQLRLAGFAESVRAFFAECAGRLEGEKTSGPARSTRT